MIMSANSFGRLFKITTWGESHGKAIGVVVDGCPAGIDLSNADINHSLAKRAPGKNAYTSPRKEPDQADIYSGVLEGKTTGSPISIIIPNQQADPSQYEPIKHLLRPGHANYTYQQKYGIFDYRGGGRASARETACRVAAGAVAQKLLETQGIRVVSYIRSIGLVDIETVNYQDVQALEQAVENSLLNCPDQSAETRMKVAIESAKKAGDSLGGVVEFIIHPVPVGLGDPVYEKLDANLAKAMLSLPATKGFEIGEGFSASRLPGSVHNDAFTSLTDQPLSSNHAGGLLGGITSGMPVVGRGAFKPTSSIRKPQTTVDEKGHPQVFSLPVGAKHDSCVAIRAVPVVSAMCQLVIADALLANRCVQIDTSHE